MRSLVIGAPQSFGMRLFAFLKSKKNLACDKGLRAETIPASCGSAGKFNPRRSEAPMVG